ncbi:MAG: PEGA domain-containing protein [Treponema sp.]|nr:PEGA domain-containing protein [Treponema sp.]
MPLSCRRGPVTTAPVFFCFFFAAASLYPRGKTEELPPPVNTEYVFCVTAFDVSELPPAQAGLGPILQSRLASRLRGIDRRVRNSEELVSYRERAFSRARDGVVSQIAAKRAERDELLFRGLPRWKYNKELRRLDKEIGELEELLIETENETILVEARPLFVLLEGAFPPPPLPGGEEDFLDEQKADAFLSGKLSSYYGRIYAELRIYTRDSSFLFEDAVIFSWEDVNDAADDLADRVEEAAAGTARSVLTVAVEPENARVVINGKLAANRTPELLNPGSVSVSVSAEGYENFSGSLELAPGEQAETAVALAPVDSEILRFSVSGARIYIGALYAGTVPPGGDLEIAVPRDGYRHISAETETGERGEIIVLGEQTGGGRLVGLNPRIIPGKDEKPVERRRRQFYGAWGRLWITLPLAFFLDGVARSYATAYNSSGSDDILNRYNTSFYVSRGAMIAAGIFGVESLIRLIIYINTANREAVPLWK